MNILVVCTSNADRSPALEKHFSQFYPNHNYRSAGINRYFTDKKGTRYLTEWDMIWADVVIYAEAVHNITAKRLYPQHCTKAKKSFILALGEYEKGNVNYDYLNRAEQFILKNIKDFA